MEPMPLSPAETTPSGRPRRITNPVVGDVLTVVESGEETNQERLVVEIQLAPHGGNAMHVHLHQTESFRVLDGELQVSIRGERRTLAVGEEASVPPGTPHRFFSDSGQPTTFRVTVLEPGRLEDGLRILYGLARDGKVTKKGIPKDPLVMALGSQWSDMYLAAIPIWLQKAMFKPLAALARGRGYETKLETYLEADVDVTDRR
jgi:quercetin dioxygenase-like cupin family protein